MASVAAKPAPRRRGGRRLIIALALVILLIAGGVVWLNIAAQAQVNASAALTVYQPATSVSHNGADFASAATGAVLQAGDSVRTDTKGRAAITLPDGTITRLASNTTIKLDSAHFTKTGNMHDVSLTQQVGRTFTNVQHLVSGATFDVHGKSATASVRGTKFEVYTKTDGTMLVKLFDGTLVITSNKGTVTLHSPQQVTIDPDGNIGPPGPITPDPDDPFGPALDASNAVQAGTTPGTEQDFVGAALHNGERQQYTYSYAEVKLLKTSLGFAGSAMKLTVKAPDNQQYFGTGKSPITVVVNNAPPGIYTIFVDGVSGLGASGEEPFVAVASVEDCKSADVEQFNAVHRGYTAQDLITAVQQSGQASGISNLSLTISENTIAGAIITAKGTYNGFAWSGSAVIAASNGSFSITPTSGTIFGMNVPAQQVVDQIAAVIGENPSNINPGFTVDRLFTCNSVLMVDGRTGAA
ncbi:MAG TPA: FecR family protein [Candidatus Dormibacteraeota bacterium]|nr:FecR family protein [Candidatus Dormibacteraeota bacterium]